MSNEAFIDAVLGLKSSAPIQHAARFRNQMDRRGRRCSAATAAVVRGKLLALATVETFGPGLRLRPKSATFFELDTREQSDIVRVAENVLRHLASTRVRRILLRMAPEKGPYSAMGAVYRLETILQLTTGLVVDGVHTQKVGAWARNTHVPLPEPEVAGASLAAAQRSAIQTAAFGLLGE